MKKAAAVLVLVLASLALFACGSSSSTSSSTASSTPTTSTTAGGGGSQARRGSASAGGRTSSGGASTTVSLEADPSGQLKYTTDQLTAKAGNVTIAFKNPQPVAHDVAVESSSGQKVGESALITSSSTALNLKNLKPGTYTYFCTVPGHEQAGMKGTLTVK